MINQGRGSAAVQDSVPSGGLECDSRGVAGNAAQRRGLSAAVGRCRPAGIGRRFAPGKNRPAAFALAIVRALGDSARTRFTPGWLIVPRTVTMSLIDGGDMASTWIAKPEVHAEVQ